MTYLEGSDILSLEGIQRDELESIFETSRAMEEILRRRSRESLLADKVLGLAFFQVSTRTRISFESAMQRLMGGVVGFADPKTTRAGDYYQESLHDVMRMMEHYADAVVIRHPRDHAPAEAASYVDIPVINAGDGYNEHPTQSLLDVYTILRERGHLDDMRIALVGDMNMRVMHSLPFALAPFSPQVYFVSPPDQAMPEAWLERFRRSGLAFEQRTDLEAILGDLDVIYLMGTKTPSYAKGLTERPSERPRTPAPYVIDIEKLQRARSDLILLHPLPRTDELPPEVDQTEAARYFRQAYYGVAVRMALLAMIFGRAG